MTPSPVETLLRLNGGEDAVLELPLVGSSAQYDETSTTDFVASTPQTHTVKAIVFDNYQEGMQQGEVATILISSKDALTGQDLPFANVPIQSRVRLSSGLDYTVLRCRRRVFMARVDGFDLYLGA